MKIQDLAPILCDEVKSDRPCIYVKSLLTKKECESILKSIKNEHVKPSLVEKDVPPGTRSTFTKSHKLIANLIQNQRLKKWIPKNLDGGTFVGLREEFMHVRYFQNQSLFNHIDVRQHLQGDTKNIQSRMSLTIYLDETYEGGELGFVENPDPASDTMLFNFGGLNAVFQSYSKPKLLFHPSPGDAVIFYQNFPPYSHCVYPLKSGMKSIMRTDFMYMYSSELTMSK